MWNKINLDREDIIFGLDIGTRTVVGVIGFPEEGKLRVIDVEVLEHDSRAMMDGQIHDIVGVIKTVDQVKNRLEDRLGIKLEKVSIAAAGRVLKTLDVSIEKEIDSIEEITKQQAANLEVEALLKAQNEFGFEISQNEGVKFYCVGHSVTHYLLDGYSISNLVGHRGKKIGVSILATFLPAVVVDSLYAVMSKIGLSVSSLTLEPIAAINVAIPKDIRILNLALIDIGAGTSDIAITRDGAVVAYSMVPIAGDEITESIAQHFLVDFNTAEKIKLSMGERRSIISFVDILGKKCDVSTADLEKVIKPSLALLADAIVERILEHNKRPTNAVFLIGGGSQIPGICAAIASRLDIPEERVAIRGRDIIKEIDWDSNILKGPEAITPFGIAVAAMNKYGSDFMEFILNGKTVKLFVMSKVTVGDVVAREGFQAEQLIGRSGKSLVFNFNGTKKVVRGESGKQAEIYVNQKAASIDTIVSTQDEIRVEHAINGRSARVFVKDMISSVRRGSVKLNGSYVSLDADITINGRVEFLDSEICEGDNVEVAEIDTVGKLMEQRAFMLTDAQISLNEKADASQRIVNGDVINIKYSSNTKNMDVFDVNMGSNILKETYDDKVGYSVKGSYVSQDKYTKKSVSIATDEHIKVTVNGMEHKLKKNKSGNFFVEILSQIDFDTRQFDTGQNHEGKLIMKLNGTSAGFTDDVRHGDSIEIYWEK